MNTGTVKFFNASKGFGIIVYNNSNDEIFVHTTGLIDEIKEGDQVTFIIESGKRGMNAVGVRIA